MGVEWTGLGLATIAIGLATALRSRRGGGAPLSRWGLAAALAGLAVTALAFGAARGWAREEEQRRLRREAEDLARDVAAVFAGTEQVARVAAAALAGEATPPPERIAGLARSASASTPGVADLFLIVPEEAEGRTAFAAAGPALRLFLEEAARSRSPRVSSLLADRDGKRRVLIAARAGDDLAHRPRLVTLVVDPAAVVHAAVAQHPRP
ncbi:MAG: hypothetical protein H6Q01_1134, partial [Acidobacteria bacterium]|nr:hypothetical protein [Acidobacteriota bacterium]